MGGGGGWGLRLVKVPVEVERVVYEERIVEVAPDPNRPLRSPRPSTLDSRR